MEWVMNYFTKLEDGRLTCKHCTIVYGKRSDPCVLAAHLKIAHLLQLENIPAEIADVEFGIIPVTYRRRNQLAWNHYTAGADGRHVCCYCRTSFMKAVATTALIKHLHKHHPHVFVRAVPFGTYADSE